MDDQHQTPQFLLIVRERLRAPIAAILIPTAFFPSDASPTGKQPNGLMYLAYVGALFLAAAVLSLGVGLIRPARRMEREAQPSRF